MAYSSFPCAKCGTSVSAGGKQYSRKRADSYAAYCKKRGDICGECTTKALAEKNQKAAALSVEMGLLELKGSEKQVAWASSIRLAALPMIDTAMKYLMADALSHDAERLSEEAKREIADAIAFIGTELKANTEAGWWIDNRNLAADRLEAAEFIARQARKQLKTLAPTAFAGLNRREVSDA